MFLTYGGYRHLDNEARLMSFIVRPGMTPRGKRATTIYEMHVQLEINLPVSMAGATTEIGRAHV